MPMTYMYMQVRDTWPFLRFQSDAEKQSTGGRAHFPTKQNYFSGHRPPTKLLD